MTGYLQVRIARDPHDQAPRGFAFVTYRERDAAIKAVAEFKDLEVKVRLKNKLRHLHLTLLWQSNTQKVCLPV